MIPKVNFYLDTKHTDKKGKAPIFLYCSSGGSRFVMSTGAKIEPDNWNSADDCIILPDLKRNANIEEQTAYMEAELVNKRLDKYRDKIMGLYWSEFAKWEIGEDRKIDSSFYKERIMIPKNQSVFDVYADYQKAHSHEWSDSYKKGRADLLNFLKEYEKKTGTLTFQSFDRNFPLKFMNYCWKEVKDLNGETGLYNGTVNLRLNEIKGFLLWAKSDFPNGVDTWKYKIKLPGPRDNIWFLLPEELEQIRTFKITNKTLREIRDLGVFNANTGLRYGDLYKLKKSDIKKEKGGYIQVIEQKTKTPIRIPLLDVHRKILDRYKDYDSEYALPQYHNSYFNKKYKKIAEMAGIESEIKEVNYKGEDPVIKTRPKHEVMASHAACRKTFVCTLATSKEMTIEKIRALTGHKSKAIERYFEFSIEYLRELMDGLQNGHAKEAEI